MRAFYVSLLHIAEFSFQFTLYLQLYFLQTFQSFELFCICTFSFKYFISRYILK